METRKTKPALIFLLLFAIVMLAVSCSEKTPVRNIETLQLKGAVCSVNEEFYFAGNLFDKIILKDMMYKTHYRFDTSGRFTEYIYENTFLIRQKSTPPITIDTLLLADTLSATDTLTRHQCDSTAKAKCGKEQDSLKEESFEEPNYICKKYQYVNDSTYAIGYFDKQGLPMGYENCHLKNNKPIFSNKYSANDRLLSKTEYTYNKKGKLAQKIVYYETTSYETSYTYTLFGNKHELHTHNQNNKLSIYSFNNKGLIAKRKDYACGIHMATSYYQYNSNSDIISLQIKDEITNQSKETLYSYFYDQHNNWTERIEKHPDTNIFVTRRHIAYY